MKLYKNYLAEFEKGLIGYSTIAIIGQSCLGSIAAMYILMSGNSIIGMVQLFLVTISCMGFNATVLSQQKAKTRFNVLLFSILISGITIIINFPTSI